MRARSLALAALAACVITAGPAAAQEAPAGPIVVTPPPTAPGRIDNMRFGLAHFGQGGIQELFAGGQAVSLGLDYRLAEGLAIGWDTFNLYQDYGGAAYFLSINPVQLRYRMGLPWRENSVLAPFASVGGGATLMSLLGGPTGKPQLGLGFAASAGFGAIINDAFTVELGMLTGQVSQIPYSGWQLRMGTGFNSLGSLGAIAEGIERARLAVFGPAAPLTGQVRAVRGDRLTIAFEHGSGAIGEALLVYYVDGITVKVAKATLVAVAADGAAVAQVEAATEPIKPGYRVRAW